MKIKISKSFFILFLFFIIFYDYKQLIVFFLALILHELSHLFLAKKYNLKINSFHISPFGIYCIIDGIEFLSLFKKIKITGIGVFVNLLLFSLFFILNINNIYATYFIYYNLFIFLFNLLPIYPLDGSKLLLYICSYFYGYLHCAKQIISLGKIFSSIIILLGFILTILFPTNIFIYLLGVYLFKKQNHNIYTKLYYDFFKSIENKYTHINTLPVKTIYINKCTTLNTIFKYFSYDNYLIFVYEKNSVLFDYTEKELFDYISTKPLHTTIDDLLNTSL